MPLAGIHPEAMANLRGMMAAFPPSSAARTLTAMGSLLVIGFAALGWRRAVLTPAMDLAFGNAVIAGLLVGYHLSPHDLSLLLLPLAFLAHHFTAANRANLRQWPLAGLAAILFLPPLHVILIVRHHYNWAAIGLLILFAANYFEIRRPAVP